MDDHFHPADHRLRTKTCPARADLGWSSPARASADGDPASSSYPEIAVGGFSRVDATVAFYQRVQALLGERSAVLDYGAGRGVGHVDESVAYRRRLRDLRGADRLVIGVDPDPVVLENPSLDRAHVLADGDCSIPLADGSIDLVVSDFVFEHLVDPEPVCAELSRVLAPGGWLCVRTTSRLGYVAQANLLLGGAVKNVLLSRLQPGRKEGDVFPAYYRLNTGRAFRRYFPAADFEVHSWSVDAEPSYHGNSRALYAIMKLAHRLTPGPLKNFLFVFIRKR